MRQIQTLVPNGFGGFESPSSLMHLWCSGNIPSFQVGASGSIPLKCLGFIYLMVEFEIGVRFLLSPNIRYDVVVTYYLLTVKLRVRSPIMNNEDMV